MFKLEVAGMTVLKGQGFFLSFFFKAVLGSADCDYFNDAEFGSMAFEMIKQKCNTLFF